MAGGPRCAICGRRFRPDVRSAGHQKYCSRRCARKAKRERDRLHKRDYRATGLGREQRKRESRKRRERVGWTEYMRYWRRADPRRAVRINRDACRRYYQQHRDELLEKRRLRRAAQKQLRKTRSQ